MPLFSYCRVTHLVTAKNPSLTLESFRLTNSAPGATFSGSSFVVHLPVVHLPLTRPRCTRSRAQSYSYPWESGLSTAAMGLARLTCNSHSGTSFSVALKDSSRENVIRSFCCTIYGAISKIGPGGGSPYSIFRRFI